MRRLRFRGETLAVSLCLLLAGATAAAAPGDEPKQTPGNTISIRLAEPVKPQTFPRPIRFSIERVIDRSGNPQPLLIYKSRGGIFLDREPAEIVRQAFEDSLRAAGLLAPDKASADYLLSVYVFHFGQAPGSGLEFFGKVDLNVVVKDAKSGQSQEVTALGTSIRGRAITKKNIQKNVLEDMDDALRDALRNFLRGTKLREAVSAPPPKAHPCPLDRGSEV